MAEDLASHTAGTPATQARHAFDRDPRAVAAEIDLTGSARLSEVAGPQWLAQARRHAESIAARGEHEIMIEGAGAGDLAFMRTLTSDPRLHRLLESVSRTAYPDADPDDREFSCSMRVIQGADPLQRPLWFHYDASVITVVIPIVIPDAEPGQRGELVVCPNHRPYRSSALANIAEKAVVQSDVYRRRFLRTRRWQHDAEIVDLEPGDAYLFWGYRSYHATLPVAPGATRVTVVLHYKNVHAGSRILRHAKTFRRLLRAM